ncbi:3'-5' RNA helicase YTHDC2-like [Mercenaria mercenaria]|uniref:3'-5' RNA helicase YTHDC2-like n=1 Tax=Mercenaria mercenaria TaxID=6596 RepID=UPI00234F1BDA|nr:3'-5' RNA helicase YTHDC2-like [Mercenaria mercenaria]XP_053405455.1 3'-5' RNA helicase YTHDC2-like [Mercenaria mercenaria]
MPKKGKKPDWGVRPDVGPKPYQDICISEEVKIGINLAIERFRLNETQKELEFPTSLTATERAYIHRLSDELSLKHKSKGQGASRYLVLAKKDVGSMASRSAAFQLVRNSRYQIGNMLQRFPVTSKERQELLPNTDKSQVNEVSKELACTATGRLNNGIPQIPPVKGRSDLQNFTKSLPINQYKEEILGMIRENQVCLISGETGSGKTTQVPQMILDDCHQNKQACRIFCTQPRRIAALSISERVASERNENVGQTVGFQIRLESRVSPKTLLTFCTNGVLLRTLMGSGDALSTVTHVIVDEVHERDKFCDFLMVSLRDIVRRRPDFKVILMSATLNTELFVKYFDNCPAICVPGNLFPVEEYYLEDVIKWTGYTNRKMEKYRVELDEMETRTEQLSQWCNQDPNTFDPRTFSKRKRKKKKQVIHGVCADIEIEESSSDTDREPDDRADLTEQLSSLGLSKEKDKDELEPWLIQEMDQCLSDIWLSGNEEQFPQVFYLIASENVSVDYQHSETTVTPLMIAAGRGFIDIVEQLLAIGADPTVKSSNDWTALDWAKKFEQTDIIALLEAHMLACEIGPEHEDLDVDEDSSLSEEDKKMLTVYQHCWDDDKVDIELAKSLLYIVVSTQPDGAVLIFLPGYDEIISLRNRIEDDDKFSNIRYSMFLLHSSMQSADQKKVFKPAAPGIRKIILATNIAETSITINDVVYVINSGKVKEKTFDALLKITMLKSNWISKASSAQRRGRAGRVRPGVCYHMYSKVRYHHLCDFATPELLRCPLQEICLQTKLLAPMNESIAEFLSKAPEPPPFLVTRSAISVLKQMDALDSNEDLTELGRHLADLPVEPHLGKMVLNSIVLKCIDPVLTIVCSLAYKDPFLLPGQPSEKRQVGNIRHEFAASTYSDHMALLRLFQAWQKARTDGWERSFCSKNYVSPAVMEMIVGMRAQLLGQLRASGFVRARGGGDIRDLNTNSENWAVVKASLCAGAYPNIIRWDKPTWRFVGQVTEKIKLHTSSVLPQQAGVLPSEWLFYEEMTRSGKRSIGGLACVRCCTVISPATVAIFAGPSKLPSDALKDTAEEVADSLNTEHGPTSDSENEDPEDNKSCSLQFGDWLTFKADAESASLTLQLRQKWNSLFLRRMRAPSKPCTQMDEAVISAVVNVLTNEEQALGLQQPAGIGQRPRPMSAESIMSGGYAGHGQSTQHESSDNTWHRFSTSAKKASGTPTKRRDFMSPKMNKSGDNSQHNSPSLSQHGSDKGSPFHSPMASGSGAARYFIMKCSSQRNIDISINKGAWATSKANEQRLNKAFQEGSTVYLIYSIQGSGHFQGYAIMSSCVGAERSSDYNGQGGVFSVDWIKRGNLQFQATHHLLNPWNENKRVQVSRDGQEIEPSVGEALTCLWDCYNDDSSQIEAAESKWTGSHQYANNNMTPRGAYDECELYTDFGRDGSYGNSHNQYGYQGQQYGNQQYGNQGQQYGYHGQQFAHTRQPYGHQQGYEAYQSWGGNGGNQQRYNYNQRHYSNRGHGNTGFGNYGYHNQNVEYQMRGYDANSPLNRNSPVMILQRGQHNAGYHKNKK